MQGGPAQRLFRETFGAVAARGVRVPACLELLGNHTDYNDGLVLTAAIDRYLSIAASPRTDGQVELAWAGSGRRERFPVTTLQGGSASEASVPVRHMLLQLRQKRVHFSGFTAAIHNDIPPGLGLAETAALRLASALALRQLFPFSLTELGADLPPRRDARNRLPPLTPKERLLLARLSATGTEGGAGGELPFAAPATMLTARAWHAVGIDCRFQTVDLFPLVGEAWVLGDSGVRSPDPRAAAAEIRAECAAAAQALMTRSLRSVELPFLKANRGRLTERQYACAYHVVTENQRVVHAERALREEDHVQFGHYLTHSHESSRDHLANSCAELDALVGRALKQPGCLGARLTGPGFGGAVLSLVAYHQVPGFLEQLADFPHPGAAPVVCQVVDGAS